MTYKEQLRDRRWQVRRNIIPQRDKFECQNPKCKTRLDPSVLIEVHHIDYIADKMAWEYPDSMLISLCSRCHAEEKDRPREERYMIQTLRIKGFLLSDLLSLSCKIETDNYFTEKLLKVLREFQEY